MLLTYITLVYLGVAGFLYLFQNSFIYFPSKGPAQHDLEILSLKINNEEIEVFVLNRGQQHGLVYFGGNAESVAYNAPDFVHHLQESTIYLVNYRGYGESTGRPSEQGLYQDALAIYDHLQPQHEKISVLGRSLGSGIASYLAAKRKIHKLVLVTPFDSVTQVAQKRFPIYPIALLLREKYDSYSRVKQISASTLVILAEHDRVIAAKHSENLISQFNPQQIRVEMILQAGHNDLSQHPRYMQSIKNFLF